MTRKQDVMNLFNFMIDLLKEQESPQTEVTKELLVEDEITTNTPLPLLNSSPDAIVDLMKRVDEISKHDSVAKTVTDLRERLTEANFKLREAEIESLKEEKLKEETSELALEEKNL